MDPDVLKVLTSLTEKQHSCSPSHACHVFSGDWVLVIHCFCPLVHTIFTTANRLTFVKHLPPLLLITTYCFHRKALWPGHKAPQDLTHCSFPFTPLLTCCPVQWRSQHSSSPHLHLWIFHTCLYLPLYLWQAFLYHPWLKSYQNRHTSVKPATSDSKLLEYKT